MPSGRVVLDLMREINAQLEAPPESVLTMRSPRPVVEIGENRRAEIEEDAVPGRGGEIPYPIRWVPGGGVKIAWEEARRE